MSRDPRTPGDEDTGFDAEDRRSPEDVRLGRLVDHVLGENDATERAMFRDALTWDLELAVEVGETQAMFESLRGLEIEPSGRVEHALRHAVLRRRRLRALPRLRFGELVGIGLRVAAVAVLTLGLGAALFGDGGLVRQFTDRADCDGPELALALAPRIEMPILGFGARAGSDRGGWERVGADRGGDGEDAELRELLGRVGLAVDAPEFRAEYARLADRPIPDDFVGLMSAENLLARLRAESALRFSSEARREMRRAAGTADFDGRIDALAAAIAQRIQNSIDRDPEDLAFALRALVAAGSNCQRGAYADAVVALRNRLVRELPALAVGPRATVLAALADLAVVGDDGLTALVAEGADAVARSALRPGRGGARPELLNWLTPTSQLADTGRLLLIAPAFGTHAGLAFRARLSIAAHLSERVRVRAGSEQPDLVAALLYGFGDLVDRDEIERRLQLWRLSALVKDPVAVHHLAWSQYPMRPGWADFQRELRGIVGVATPEDLRGAASLLLALCTNVAAPGVSEQLPVGAI